MESCSSTVTPSATSRSSTRSRGVRGPVAYLLVLYALRRAPVTLVAPTRELSIVFGGLAAWLILKEPHPVRRLAGACVVLLGIVAIALS